MGAGRDRPFHATSHCHRAHFALYPREAHPDGPVAQRLEPAAHNGLVAGSNPARPTKHLLDITRFSVSLNTPVMSGTCAEWVHKNPLETEIFDLRWRYAPTVSVRKNPFPWRVA
jgi:hypothetical protein